MRLHNNALVLNPSGGNVGVGTTNPSVNLNVIGNTSIATYPTNTVALFQAANSAGVNDAGIMIGSVNGNTPYLSDYGSASNGMLFYTNKAERMRISAAGNVGIGTTGPGPKFHVVGGNIGVNGGNGIGFRMDIPSYNNNIGASAIYAAGLDAMRFVGESDSATPRYFVYGHHTGNDPAQAWNPRLYINSISGTFFPGLDNTATCGGSGNRWQIVYAVNGTIQTSDSNVKDSVPLSYGMNEILQMRTIKYKWKSQADLPEDDPSKNFEYYGFCADELAPLFPELVYNENTSAPVQMNYSEILPVVVNALKEEHASAVSLKATVDHQAEQIVSLQTQLGSLLAWAQTMGYPASS